MRVARFPHPAPLPGRSYWAIWEAEQPLAVFHFGEGNLIVEQPLDGPMLGCLLAWLGEVVPALEWPTLTLAMTLQASVFTRPPAPEAPPPLANGHLKPRRKRRPPRPSLDRFLGLTTAHRHR